MDDGTGQTAFPFEESLTETLSLPSPHACVGIEKVKPKTDKKTLLSSKARMGIGARIATSSTPSQRTQVRFTTLLQLLLHARKGNLFESQYFRRPNHLRPPRSTDSHFRALLPIYFLSISTASSGHLILPLLECPATTCHLPLWVGMVLSRFLRYCLIDAFFPTFDSCHKPHQYPLLHSPVSPGAPLGIILGITCREKKRHPATL